MKNSDDPTIEASALTKIYKSHKGKVVAIDEVNFRLYQGEDMAIVGPSGSGKSTLLQILGGLSKPTKGKVLVEGKSVHSGSDNQLSKFRNEKMGFIFQNIYL